MLLALVVGVFPAPPFGERGVVQAQTGPTLSALEVTITTSGDDKALTSLSPTFDPTKMSYTIRASNAVERITVAPTAANGSALGTITPADAEAGGAHQVDLSVGATTIRIPVTSGGSSRTYTVAVTRVPSSASSDTKLSSLSLSNVTLSPPFDSDKRAYSDRVPNSVSLTSVTARAANSGAMVSIKYAATATFNTEAFDTTGMAADSANIVPLADGPTSIAIKVTAADVSTEGYYTALITRAAGDASEDATLSDLTLSGVTLSPTFSSSRTAYTASVPYTTRNTTVTAPATDTSGAPVVMITSDMDDMIPTAAPNANQVDLAVGANVISVKVDADDAIATKTYTVTVTRASSTASADANLSSLNLSRVTLSPPFNPGKTSYTALVPNSVGLTTVRASTAHSGAVLDITAISGGDSVIDSANVVTLSAGTATTTITVTVTAENAVATKAYMVTVTRAADDASADAKLAATNGLAVTPTTVLLHPLYDPDKMAYIASVPYTINAITFTATAATDARVMVTSDMDDEIEDGNDAGNIFVAPLDLAEGTNVITIKVDAANAIATETYTVTVTRASSTASADANLSSLNLSRVTLSPAFDPGKAEYTALVPNSVSLTTVRVSTADSGAVVDIAAIETGDLDATSVIDSGNVVTLSAGTTTTTITITVTAANAVATKDYEVVVTRAAVNASDDASLDGLTLEASGAITDVTADDLYLNMPFISSRMAYTTTAERGQSSVIVATTPSAGARVMVSSNRDDEVKNHVTGGDASDVDFDVDLMPGVNVITIEVTAADAVSMMTYTVTVTRTGGSDSSLYSLSLSGITLEPAFTAATTAYMSAETLASDATMTTVTAMANHGGASVAISSDRDDDIGDDNVVDLDPGRNVITVMVTAEDGTSQTYTVTVTVAMGDTLLERYDANDSGQIEKDEALAAIDDYLFEGSLTKEQALEVIDLYLFG